MEIARSSDKQSSFKRKADGSHQEMYHNHQIHEIESQQQGNCRQQIRENHGMLLLETAQEKIACRSPRRDYEVQILQGVSDDNHSRLSSPASYTAPPDHRLIFKKNASAETCSKTSMRCVKFTSFPCRPLLSMQRNATFETITEKSQPVNRNMFLQSTALKKNNHF